MAIGAALVDRARLIEKQAGSRRVEGTTRMVTVSGAWFKCRLFISPNTEDTGPGDGDGRVRNLDSSQLMWAMRDENGDLVQVPFDAKVEVDSKQLGRGVYRVIGEPQMLRKKRSVIGHLANIERSQDGEFQELGA
jgi:hypothetical protein